MGVGGKEGRRLEMAITLEIELADRVDDPGELIHGVGQPAVAKVHPRVALDGDPPLAATAVGRGHGHAGRFGIDCEISVVAPEPRRENSVRPSELLVYHALQNDIAA